MRSSTERMITGTIRGDASALPFNPAKANRCVNVWFHRDGSVWFGVAESSELDIDGPGDNWVAMCELVGDHWRWEGEGVPFGFELTAIDFGDSALSKHRDAVANLKEQLSEVFTPLFDTVVRLISRLSRRRNDEV